MPILVATDVAARGLGKQLNIFAFCNFVIWSSDECMEMYKACKMNIETVRGWS